MILRMSILREKERWGPVRTILVRSFTEWTVWDLYPVKIASLVVKMNIIRKTCWHCDKNGFFYILTIKPCMRRTVSFICLLDSLGKCMSLKVLPKKSYLFTRLLNYINMCLSGGEGIFIFQTNSRMKIKYCKHWFCSNEYSGLEDW